MTVTIGSGDTTAAYLAPVAPTQLHILDGTGAEPVGALAPTLKVSRTESATRAALDAISPGADGCERQAAIVGVNVGAATTEVQAVGLFGGAKTASAAAVVGNDACGVYGVGRSLTGADGTGIGGFFLGRRDSDTGKANGLEAHVANYGTTAAAYNPAGFNPSIGVWLNCSGNADSGAAIVVSNAFGRQFEVGLAFTAQVTGGLTGGVKAASIRDDSQSVRSIDIRGSHTYGVDMAFSSITGAAMRLPNNKCVAGRNAAATADVELIKLDGIDRVALAGAKVLIEASGRLVLDGGLSQAGAATPICLPLGYLKIKIGTVDAVIPYYAAN